MSKCASGLSTCGPVVDRDADGVPLCRSCLNEMRLDYSCHADGCPCALCALHARHAEAMRLLREIDIELTGIPLYSRGQLLREEISAFISYTAAQRGEKEG